MSFDLDQRLFVQKLKPEPGDIVFIETIAMSKREDFEKLADILKQSGATLVVVRPGTGIELKRDAPAEKP